MGRMGPRHLHDRLLGAELASALGPLISLEAGDFPPALSHFLPHLPGRKPGVQVPVPHPHLSVLLERTLLVPRDLWGHDLFTPPPLGAASACEGTERQPARQS